MHNETPRDPEESGQVLPNAPDESALNRLWPIVAGELERMAHRHLAAERTDHTLTTTGLVHEVYLRLRNQRSVTENDRPAFFANAARAMRRILVDYARRHRALRRGSGKRPLSIDFFESAESDEGPQLQIAAAERGELLIALDESLERFAAINERAARVVDCRFFAGLTEEDTALALGISARTVNRDWKLARAWLLNELHAE